MNTELTKSIESIRVQKKISKKDLCAHCNIGQATYWRFVNGKTDIKVSSLVKIINFIGVELLIYNKI